MAKLKENYIGYARVSSKGQHLARQIKALTDYGIPLQNIYHEKISGAHTDKRKQLKRMLNDINHTNVVVVLAIDRLARNYKDFKRIWAKIKAKGAKLIILNLPMSKKYGANKDLGSIINEFIINMMAYQAQQERKTIRARQAQGIAIAKKNGKYHGRKPIYNKGSKGYYNLIQAFHDYFNKKYNGMSTVELCRKNNVNRNTFYVKLREFKHSHKHYQTDIYDYLNDLKN